MNQEKFIEIVKIVVEQGAVDGVLDNLKKPPGRKPEPLLVELSDWFNSLGEKEKERVHLVIKEAVSSSIFGFLCVLDGVTSIREDDDDFDPTLKLTYIGAEGEVVLNNAKEDYLHDIYNSI